MPDRNYPPFSKDSYEEIKEEIDSLGGTKNKNTVEVELIRIHLKSMESAFKLYRDQIELLLEKIETKRKQQEVLNEPSF